MRIGICVYSQRHLCTPTIPHLVRGIRSSEPSARISIRSRYPLKNTYFEYRDLLTSAAKKPFSKWVKDLDVLLWLYKPDNAQKAWASEQNCRQVLLLPWSNIAQVSRDEAAEFYKGWDGICAPSYAAEAVLSAYFSLKNVFVLPWGLCVPPIIRRSMPFSNKQNLALLAYSDARNTSIDVFSVLSAILNRFPSTRLVILLDSKRGKLAAYSRRMEKRFKDRVIVGANLREHERMRVLTSMDLSIVAATTTDFCVPILESIYFGVPVITWETQPASEIISDGLSGKLVKSVVVPKFPGIPSVVPSWLKLEESAAEVIANPTLLRTFKNNTAHGLTMRNKIFSHTLTSILDGKASREK